MLVKNREQSTKPKVCIMVHTKALTCFLNTSSCISKSLQAVAHLLPTSNSCNPWSISWLPASSSMTKNVTTHICLTSSREVFKIGLKVPEYSFILIEMTGKKKRNYKKHTNIILTVLQYCKGDEGDNETTRNLPPLIKPFRQKQVILSYYTSESVFLLRNQNTLMCPFYSWRKWGINLKRSFNKRPVAETVKNAKSQHIFQLTESLYLCSGGVLCTHCKLC